MPTPRLGNSENELIIEPPKWAQDALGDLMISPQALEEKVKSLGALLTSEYRGRPPLLVGVLKGASFFMSDLAREIRLPLEMDFMAVSSYGSATRSSGVVRIVKDLDIDLTGRHVLVVEDIVDSGLTLGYLKRYLHTRKPASVEVCALLVKKGQQRTELEIKHVGFTIEPKFVIGYGLDIDEKYRNLSGIWSLREGDNS